MLSDPKPSRVARKLSSWCNPIYYYVPVVAGIGFARRGPDDTLLLPAIIAFLIIMVIPVTVTAILLRRGIISNFYYSDPRERQRYFFPLILLCFGIVIGSFLVFHAPNIVTAFVIASAINLILTAMTVMKFKTSLHCAGLSSLVAALTVSFGWFMVLLLLLILPIAWARIHLRQHTILEVLVGTIAGFLMTWLEMILLIPFLP